MGIYYAHAYYVSRDTTLSSHDTRVIFTFERITSKDAHLALPSCCAEAGKRRRNGFDEGIQHTSAASTVLFAAAVKVRLCF